MGLHCECELSLVAVSRGCSLLIVLLDHQESSLGILTLASTDVREKLFKDREPEESHVKLELCRLTVH